MILCPVTIRAAREFVDAHHRHHRAPQGGLFAVGVASADELIGVAIIGRPVARAFADGWTAEVTRVCVLPSLLNACSMLYGAAWRAARALGYRRLVTYTLRREPGTSLRAAGWTELGRAGGGEWSCPARPRAKASFPTEPKTLWEVVA